MALDEPYVDQIKKFEGFAPRAKWDFKQWSGGYGTRAKPGQVFSPQDADGMLRGELGKSRDLVRGFAPNLPAGHEAALTSLTFNAGSDWMKSGLGQAVKAGDWDKAGQSFLQYNKAGGQVLPGLAQRRQAEWGWTKAPASPAIPQDPEMPGLAVAPAASPITTGATPVANPGGMFGAAPYTGMSPEEVAQRRKMAGGMIANSMSTEPVGHWTQGLARAIQGISGNAWMDQANQAERQGNASAREQMAAALNNGNPTAAIGGMLANPWSADVGKAMVPGVIQQKMAEASPSAQADLALKQGNVANIPNQQAHLKAQTDLAIAQAKAAQSKDAFSEIIMKQFQGAQPQQAPTSGQPQLQPQSFNGPVPTDPNFINTADGAPASPGGMLATPPAPDNTVDVPGFGKMPVDKAKALGMAAAASGKGDLGKLITDAANADHLDKTAKGEVQKEMVGLTGTIGRLESIKKRFDPKFLDIPTRAGLEWSAMQDKFGVLPDDQKKDLTRYTQFRQQAVNNAALYVKYLSGVAVSEQEYNRIQKTLPSSGTGIFDGDSPTQFQAKLDNTVRESKMAYARANYLNSQGFKGKPWEAGVALDDMPDLIDKRGAQIEQQLQGRVSPDKIQGAVRQKLKQEFGI